MRLQVPSVLIFLQLVNLVLGNTNCDLGIRYNNVADSWQSSSYVYSESSELKWYEKLTFWLERKPTSKMICFKNSSESIAGVPWFFHTAEDKAVINNGYHWFVVKLKQTTIITSVTIASRDTKLEGNDELAKDLNSRSADIEVWTSSSDNLSLGSDHCSSHNISSQLKTEPGKWKFCGRTGPADAVQPGRQLIVNCTDLHLTRHLLLRKFVGNETRPVRTCMGFNDLKISYVKVAVEMQPKAPVTQNSSLTIKCIVNCNYYSRNLNGSSKLQICHSNRGCFTPWETQIHSLQPSDSGNFTCQFDGVTVSSVNISVTYPPSELKIFQPVPNICTDKSPANVNFTFESSAAQPAPVHWCKIANSSIGEVSLRHASAKLESNGHKRSYWQCVNCSRFSTNMTLICGSHQLGIWNLTTNLTWKCKEPQVELKISQPVQSNCNEIEPADANFTLESTSTDRDVTFESSAAEPQPAHWCTANASDGGVKIMKLVSEGSEFNSRMRSVWQCVNCSRSSTAVKLTCGSSQKGRQNLTAQLTWQCRGNNLEMEKILQTKQKYAMLITVLTVILIISLVILVIMRATSGRRVSRRTGASVPVIMSGDPQSIKLEEQMSEPMLEYCWVIERPICLSPSPVSGHSLDSLTTIYLDIVRDGETEETYM